MFVKIKPIKYAGFGLKFYSKLTGWYFKHIDVDFSNEFALAKLVASSPPIFSKKSIVAAPLYTKVAKSINVTTRVTSQVPIYTRV